MCVYVSRVHTTVFVHSLCTIPAEDQIRIDSNDNVKNERNRGDEVKVTIVYCDSLT